MVTRTYWTDDKTCTWPTLGIIILPLTSKARGRALTWLAANTPRYIKHFQDYVTCNSLSHFISFYVMESHKLSFSHLWKRFIFLQICHSYLNSQLLYQDVPGSPCLISKTDRNGYEAASAPASDSQSQSIWGQSFGFGFSFSFVVWKTQSFGFSLVTWEKFRLQLWLRNLTNPKFYVWFRCLKTWKTQHFSFSNHICLYILTKFQQMASIIKGKKGYL